MKTKYLWRATGGILDALRHPVKDPPKPRRKQKRIYVRKRPLLTPEQIRICKWKGLVKAGLMHPDFLKAKLQKGNQ